MVISARGTIAAVTDRALPLRCPDRAALEHAMSLFDELIYDSAEQIATITLNRPARLNALTGKTQAELQRAMELARDDTAVRAIILTGAGRGFCAGADMQVLDGLAPADLERAEGARAFDMNQRADYQTRYSYFPAIRKPIIAAINGPCAGLGLIYAMYCDLRFASETAVFSTAFARRGLIAEHGSSWMLPRIVGHANALDILMSGRRFDAAEALRMNFVSRVLPPEQLLDAARAYARDLAENVSPRSIGVIKEQLHEVPFQTLAEAVRVANREMAASLASEDFKEGVAHFIERRPPRFSGR
jgi:enoyl-CoA hydratase/carnithine racemase